MVYAFGSFEADTELFELTNDGAPVPVQRKTFDLLVYLLRNRGRLATREELIAEVWPDVVVSEAALNQAMLMLRKVLGDDGGNPKTVQTIRGRGYRFMADVEERAAPATPPTPPPAPGLRSRTPLVGRAQCMASLEGALARAMSGSGGIAIITGEAGIGKTRVVEELAILAAAHGDARVIRGHSYGRDGAPALWPWVQIVRHLIEGRLVSAELNGEAERVLATATSISEGDAATSFPFFDLTVRVVRQVSLSTPLVLVLEDVHDAHPASLELANVLSPELSSCRVLLVVTARNAHAKVHSERWTTALGTLARGHRTEAIELAPLTRAELEELLADVTGGAPTDAMLDRIARKTGGNPLFFQQIAGVLRTEANVPREAATSAMLSAEPVKAAIAHHVARLPAETREALTVASVFGQTFPVRALAHALGVSPASAMDRLDPALRENVVRKTVAGDEGSRLGFAHALVRDVLYKELTGTELARLHGAAGAALVSTFGPDAEGPRAAEVAAQFVASAQSDTAERAVHYCLRAGVFASSRDDHTGAVGHFEAAVRALTHAGGSTAASAEVHALLVGARARAAASP
jgi:predicted ATPase